MGNLYAVILAGGGGTRFWPLSRESMPKQFLDLSSERSLLTETFLRMEKVLPKEQILVVVGKKHLEGVRKNLPELPRLNEKGLQTNQARHYPANECNRGFPIDYAMLIPSIDSYPGQLVQAARGRVDDEMLKLKA